LCLILFLFLCHASSIMKTIYILDYDADIGFVLCEWFKLHGFETKSFLTFEKLLNQVNVCQPDCLILDCLYGGMPSTINICQTIQQLFHYNGNIILTSTCNVSSQDLKACNATDFITKPFNLLEVLSIINKHLITSMKKTLISRQHAGIELHNSN
jgi:FixJ family two-component response regulator